MAERMWERRCRDCEFWDCGGEKYIETAEIGDCGNPHSNRFTSPPNHVCPEYHPDSSRWPDPQNS